MRKLLCMIIAFPLIFSFISCGDKKQSFTPVNYSLSLFYDSGENKVYGEECVVFTNDVLREIDSVKFDLYSFSTTESEKEGESIIKVIKVSDDGGELEYFYDDGDETLNVKLRRKIKHNQSVTLYLTFVTAVPQADEKLGKTQKCINLCSFYPKVCYVKGGFLHYKQCKYGECSCYQVANYSVKAKIGTEYVVASSGECVSTEAEGKYIVYDYEAENIRDFAMVLSQDYFVEEKKVDETTIKYYYITDENPQRTMELIEKCFKFFESKFCQYDYAVYSVAESCIEQAGLEQGCLSIVSADADIATFTLTVAHETAHQWWYGMVGNNQFSTPYIDEGLAEYSSMIFFKNCPEYAIDVGEYIDGGVRELNYCKDFYARIYGSFDTSLSKSVDKFYSEYDYTSVVYREGLYAFYSLDEITGGKSLIKALKHICKDKKYEIIDEKYLLDVIRRYCKHSGEAYFKSFLRGKTF